jgi:uncharacterized membrane protein HdeD (DUF308 family)
MLFTFDVVDVEADDVGPWWVWLVMGILWVLVSFVILTLDFDTVWAVAILAGLTFLFGGISEIAVGRQAPGWRWLYYLMGAISIGAGIAAFVWPGATYVVLAAIFGWYLLFLGIFDIVNAFMLRGAELWWVELLVGIALVLFGFWAVSYPGRSLVLLAVWVGAAALGRGIVDIFMAFRVKGARDRLAVA